MGVIYQEGTYYGIDPMHLQIMPAATADNVGKIVQYTGETTSNYHTVIFINVRKILAQRLQRTLGRMWKCRTERFHVLYCKLNMIIYP